MNNCKSTVTIPLRRYEGMKSIIDSLKKGEKIVLFLQSNKFKDFYHAEHFACYVTEDSVIKKINERVKELEFRLKVAENLIHLKDAAIQQISTVNAQRVNPLGAASIQKPTVSAYAINRFLDIISKMSIWEFRHYRKSIKKNRDEMLASLNRLLTRL